MEEWTLCSTMVCISTSGPVTIYHSIHSVVTRSMEMQGITGTSMLSLMLKLSTKNPPKIGSSSRTTYNSSPKVWTELE